VTRTTSRAQIAVTGASGLLGQRLLPLLERAGFDGIVGFDVREPARRARGLQFHLVDIGGTDLQPRLEGVDTIVHLAAIVGAVPDDALLHRVNVEGLRRILVAASAVGARKVVRASSAAVYGAWPNNPVPLSEEAPLRPNPGYAPAAHDAECERMLVEWAAEREGRVATRLRIAPVVGPGAQTLFANVVLGRPPVIVRGAAPPVQAVHVDDASAAIALAARDDLDGAYNVAADGWLSAEEAAALVPRNRAIPAVPYDVARRVLGALWASGLGEAPPSVLPYLVHPWVIANDRLKLAGWTAAHTNEEALLLATPAPSNIMPAVAAGGMAVASAAAAAGAVVIARRRRSRRRG
jgi:nucleoside-diphosphate-sugar epimerase